MSNVSLLLLQVSGYLVTRGQDGYPVTLSYAVLTVMAVTLLLWSVMFCLLSKEAPMQQISKSYQLETRSEQEARLRDSLQGRLSYPGNFSSQGDFSSQEILSHQGNISSRGKYSNSMLAPMTPMSQSSWERAAGEHYTPTYPRHSYSGLYVDDLRHIHSMPTPHYASKY